MLSYVNNKPHHWVAGASALALLTAAAVAGPAAAQGVASAGANAAETTASNNNKVGEVVVTAQFRRQNVQQTPIAITAVNAQMLENRGETNIAQVANQAPNVSLKPQGAAFGPSLGASIRGIGQYDFDPALEPGVGLYVDDVYYPTLTGSILDLLDLDRVEILRGPQGTLAGMNSIGGAVKLYSKAPDASQYKGWGVSGTIDYKFNDSLSLKSITAFRGYTSDWSEDNDVSPLPLGLGVEHLAHQQLSEELRLNGNLGRLIDWTVGGFYFTQKSTYASHQDLWYPGLVLDFLGDDPVPSHTYAGFAQATWHITDKLNLTGGIRYTDEAKDYTYVRLNRDGSSNLIVGPRNGITGHYAGTHVDYRADIDYQWTPDFMTYAEVSTGFKGGGVNPRPFVPAQVQPFGPETVTAYEVGLKSQWLDRHVQLNLAAFYNKYDAIQLTLLSCPQFGGPGPCALPVNGGNADVRGVEAETEIHPFGGLQIDGSASYLKFGYLASSLNPSTGILPSMSTPYTPKWKWSAGVQYAFDVMDKGSLIPRVDVAYQDSVYSNAVNGPLNQIPAYTVANARLTWRAATGGWEAALEVTNFTNKLYYLTTFDLTGAGGGSVSGEPAMPREWSVSLKKSF